MLTVFCMRSHLRIGSFTSPQTTRLNWKLRAPKFRVRVEFRRFEIVDDLGMFIPSDRRQCFQLDQNGVEAHEIDSMQKGQRIRVIRVIR
jgi:hypothetical protein